MESVIHPHLSCTVASMIDVKHQPLPSINSFMSIGLAESLIKAENNNFLKADNSAQFQVLLQAQVLMRKNNHYRQIDDSLRNMNSYRPWYYNIPDSCENIEIVTSVTRDKTVHSLRFINLFYGFPSTIFAESVNIFDRLIGRVKTHPNYLTLIACACFHMAAMNQNTSKRLPTSQELVKMTQCGGSGADLERIRALIVAKLDFQRNERAITSVTFLRQFYDVYCARHFEDSQYHLQIHKLHSILEPQLEVLICQSEFTRFRFDVQALALLCFYIENENQIQYSQYSKTILELQHYCQISDCAFNSCIDLTCKIMTAYKGTVTRKPSSQALRLFWSMSKRNMSKIRPSTKTTLELAPIIEDEILHHVIDESDASTDTGLFDSENDLDTLPTELLIAKGITLCL